MGIGDYFKKLLFGEGALAPQKNPAVIEHWEEIYNDPESPGYGNPQGDATFVEFIDYR
jgi:hypothetical protein